MLAMCVYDRISREMTNDANTYKLISDIKDAVNLLTDQKLKGYDTGTFIYFKKLTKTLLSIVRSLV